MRINDVEGGRREGMPEGRDMCVLGSGNGSYGITMTEGERWGFMPEFDTGWTDFQQPHASSSSSPRRFVKLELNTARPGI